MVTITVKNLTQRYNVWFARMIVPADVQAALGKKVLIRTTGEASPARASIVAAPIIRGWQREIAAARAGGLTDIQAKVRDLTAAYRRTHGLERDEVLEDAIAYVAQRLTKTHPDDLAILAHTNHDSDRHAALEGLPGGRQAQAMLDIVTGTATPFLIRFPQWRASLNVSLKSPKGRVQYARIVSTFAERLEVPTLESVTHTVLHGWLEHLVLEERMSPLTAVNALAALRSYWGHLQGHGLVSREQSPFLGLRAPKVAVRASASRKPFAVSDVTKLVQAAYPVLVDLITLGAYTGARIEELCSLRWEDVDMGAGVLRITDSKTKAGIRDVPMVALLKQHMEGMKAGATGPHVIPGLTTNVSGQRSASIGARFSKLKAAQGFGPEVVFHSFRKLVATLLEECGCPEPVAADILGHEHRTLTYGLYSGGASAALKAEWMAKALAPLDEALGYESN